MYDLGSRIKEAREKRGITQGELARRMNRSVPTISSYETNAQTPPTDVLLSIANALHVSLDYLLEWEGRKSYSVEDLSDAQKELIDLLYCEFTKPTREEGTLSRQQIEILQKLILIFQNGSC